MHEAAKGFLRHLSDKKKRDYHQTKWDGMSEFFKAKDVDAVDSPFLMTLVDRLRKRKGKENTESTVHKYLVTTRRILKFSIRKGWLKTVPLFPELGTIVANPRPWFEEDQWKRLVEEAEERV